MGLQRARNLERVSRHIAGIWSQTFGAPGEGDILRWRPRTHNQCDPHFHSPRHPNLPAISVAHVEQYVTFHVPDDTGTPRHFAPFRQPQQHKRARIQAISIQRRRRKWRRRSAPVLVVAAQYRREARMQRVSPAKGMPDQSVCQPTVDSWAINALVLLFPTPL